MTAGVLQAVGHDHENRVLRYVLLPGVVMDAGDVPDGPSQGVQQSSAAAHRIVLLRHGENVRQLRPVADGFAFVVEKHSGDEAPTLRLPLLFDQAVEASDGVPLQPVHGAAAVQDEYELGDVVVHEKTSCTVFCDHSIGGFTHFAVARQATIVTGSHEPSRL